MCIFFVHKKSRFLLSITKNSMYQPEFFRNTSSMFKKTTVHYLSQEKKQKKGHGLMKEIYQLNKEELFRTCGNPEGLTTTDAKERLQTSGPDT